MLSKQAHPVFPITKKSIQLTRDYPEFFHGSPFIANGLFYTDRQVRRILKKGSKIKLKR